MQLLAQSSKVLEEGPHHRTLEVVYEMINELGEIQPETNKYTVVETSLNYWSPENNKFLPSSPSLELANGNALALKTRHQAIFSPDILDENGVVDLQMPDTKRLRFRCIGIAYAVPGIASVFIAETKSSNGELLGDREVVYPSAFEGLSADIRLRHEKASIEQDIILRRQLPPLNLFNLSTFADDLFVQVWTEFLETPTPEIHPREISTGRRTISDCYIDFGSMQIPSGKAFSLGDTATSTESIPVAKEWLKSDDGKIYLVESVPYRELQVHLEKLPAWTTAGRIDKNKLKDVAKKTTKRSKPQSVLVYDRKAPAKKTIQIASADTVKASREKGVVIDFIITSSQVSYTFLSSETYYVSGECVMTGTTTFSPGCILKFSPTNSPKLTINGPINWLGQAYAPVILTTRSDPVGDAIGGPAVADYHADVALNINATTANADAIISYVRIQGARKAIYFNGRSGHVVSHAQFVNCEEGITGASAEVALRNGLFTNVLSTFKGSSVLGRCEHLTVNSATWFNNNSLSTLYLTNSLLVNVGTRGTVASLDSVSEISSASGVFAGVGSGSHYLVDGTYRNSGNPIINAAFLKELRQKTTYPPIILTNAVLNSLVLSPQAQRDTDLPDRGWHYDPVDWFVNNLSLTNINLTLTNGVALGVFGIYGINLYHNAKLISEGNPLQMNRLFRYQSAQEQTNVWGQTAAAMALVQVQGATSYQPEILLRFTGLAMLPGSLNTKYFIRVGRYAPSKVSLSDCQIVGGVFSYSISEDPRGMTIAFTNNLFQSANVSIAQGYLDQIYGVTPTKAILRDNLFRKCTMTLEDYSHAWPWEIHDNLFDSSTIGVSGTTFVNSYNAFLNTTSWPNPGTGSQTLSSLAYESGPLSLYYLPQASSLINAGSRTASAATLYHFTTAAATQAKEAATQVDISFHPIALNASNLLFDYDSDGVPDYLEDRNGNGVFDTSLGEKDWQVYTSPNGFSSSLFLQLFTPLK